MNRTPFLHVLTLTPRQTELIRAGLHLLPRHLTEAKEYRAAFKGLQRKMDHCEEVQRKRAEGEHP